MLDGGGIFKMTVALTAMFFVEIPLPATQQVYRYLLFIRVLRSNRTAFLSPLMYDTNITIFKTPESVFLVQPSSA